MTGQESAKSQSAGADVMITNFGDFCPFSEKKLSFFLKSNAMIQFFSPKVSSIFKQKYTDFFLSKS
jgi:hypothetical protein